MHYGVHWSRRTERDSFSEIIHSVKLCLIVPSFVFMEVVESDIFLNLIDIE